MDTVMVIFLLETSWLKKWFEVKGKRGMLVIPWLNWLAMMCLQQRELADFPAWHSDENYRLAILCAPNYSGMGGEHGLFDHVIFYWGFGGCGPFQTFTLKFWIGGVAKKSQRCCFGSLRKGLA